MIQIKCEICKNFSNFKYPTPEAVQFYIYKNQLYAICGGHLLLQNDGIIDKEQYLKYKVFE